MPQMSPISWINLLLMMMLTMLMINSILFFKPNKNFINTKKIKYFKKKNWKW
uniref:ATP synthase F0 subunit 8 n=1 Tax=Rhotana formosana TaxID=3081105 RepID=UPI002A8300DD|nr:ATP synthase F0 subunit 8 [Rhotana formosana]WOW99129.1 ATP synthase F0 subunit 8 [Rhotana formosana]